MPHCYSFSQAPRSHLVVGVVCCFALSVCRAEFFFFWFCADELMNSTRAQSGSLECSINICVHSTMWMGRLVGMRPPIKALGARRFLRASLSRLCNRSSRPAYRSYNNGNNNSNTSTECTCTVSIRPSRPLNANIGRQFLRVHTHTPLETNEILLRAHRT